MTKQVPIDIVSNLEQFEAAMVNIAPIIASYYKALKDNGIPDLLARQLTVEWCNLFWASQFPTVKK